MAKRITASNFGINVVFEIRKNLCFIKVNNPMMRGLFKRMLSDKGQSQPSEQGAWDIYEINGTEEQIAEELKKSLKTGGLNIVSEEDVE